jgi:predicted glycosyltransferase involved in capsule biosynthesis
MTTFNINFKLTRDDDLRSDDKSWFDKEHISSEIKSWLEDLDYEVNDIQIDGFHFYYKAVPTQYHEEAKNILWEYTSKHDYEEIQKRLEELE